MCRRRLLFELYKQRALALQTVSAVLGNPAPTFHNAGSNRKFSSAACGCGAYWSGSHRQPTGHNHESVAHGRPSNTCRGVSQVILSGREFTFFSILRKDWGHAARDTLYRRSHSEQAAATCWFCGEVLQSLSLLVCPNCGYVQHVREELNYFQLFGIREDFDVDLGQLQKALQRLQLMVHPDKHSTKGDSVRQLAEQQSSRLNKAFSALRSPLERAKYLLELKGSPVQEDARLEDPEFLVQVMELREEVEEAEQEDRVRELLAENARRREEWESKILKAFATSQLAEAQRLVFEMAYWDRIEEQLKDKL